MSREYWMNQSSLPNLRWVHKHEIIIEAATDVFLTEGFSAASMEAIAKKAAVSKVTIYKHFENKNRLFNEMMRYYCQNLYKNVPVIIFSLSVSSEKILTEFAKRLIKLLSQSRSISLIRVVVAESSKFPEGISLWENGRMPLQDIFSDYLIQEVSHGRMIISHIDVATKQFFGMIKEHFIWPLLTGMKAPSALQANEFIECTIQMFLKQYQKIEE